MSFDFGVKFQDSQIIYFHCKWYQSYICFLWEMVQYFYFTTLVVIQSTLPISFCVQGTVEKYYTYSDKMKYLRHIVLLQGGTEATSPPIED